MDKCFVNPNMRILITINLYIYSTLKYIYLRYISNNNNNNHSSYYNNITKHIYLNKSHYIYNITKDHLMILIIVILWRDQVCMGSYLRSTLYSTPTIKSPVYNVVISLLFCYFFNTTQSKLLRNGSYSNKKKEREGIV